MSTYRANREPAFEPPEFPRFNDLPTEIRLMIWRATPRGPKIFVVDFVPRDPRSRVSVNLGHVSRVCHEARDALLYTDKQLVEGRQLRLDARTDLRGNATESTLFRTPRECGWVSPSLAYFDPSQDSIYLSPLDPRQFDSDRIKTLDKLIGPVKKIIVNHGKVGGDNLFVPFWRNMHLDSISSLLETIDIDEPIASILSDQLGAALPIAVSLDDQRSVDIVDRILAAKPGVLEQWQAACEHYHGIDMRTFGAPPCSWTHFTSLVRFSWLSRVLEEIPLQPEDELNPPIDGDGLILNYAHPWVKEWWPTIPQFKAVVMFAYKVEE